MRRATAYRRRLATDGEAREQHERLHAPWRALSSDGVSPFELDEVGAWLAHEYDAKVAVNEGPSRAGRFAWAGLTAALALALAVGLWRTGIGDDASAPEVGALVADASGLRARGDEHGGALALEALCGPDVRFARPGGCRLDEELTFAFRMSADFEAKAGDGGRLVLFGVDAAGDALFYAPTPEPADAVPAPLADVRGAGWMGAGFGVRLGVNHEAGPLRVYALWTHAKVTADDVRTWAARLHRVHPIGDAHVAPRWPIAAGLVGSAVCPSQDACADAWLDLNLTPAGPSAGPQPGESSF